MKGYKVFNSDWTCRNRQYSCPGIFEQGGDLELCKNGIHFCRKLSDCFNYYEFNPENKVAEIEAIGNIIENKSERKCCTSKIKIIRELTWYEVLNLVNTGRDNTGFKNTGDRNTGNFNSGDFNSGNLNTGDSNSGDRNSGNLNAGDSNSGNNNSGNRNSGNRNIGNCNSGSRNSGRYNSGNYSSGDYNTGSFNTGDFNVGNFNTGGFNTGDYNVGHYNSGNHNIGNYNTGDYNIGNGSFGYFNIEENKIKLFNKQSDWTHKDWVESKASKILKRIMNPTGSLSWIPSCKMTEKQKEKYPEYKIINGILKCRKKEELTSLRQKCWNNLSKEDKESVLSLPNFDAEIFKKITKIDITIEK